ncbi:MAG: isocitrate/isopropylmalate family dehydrogenase, partial [Terriglobales bacterium]
LGMLGSATIGGEVNLYEPVHGSAPDIAGKGIANPLGAIASAAMLLRHSAGMAQEAADLEEAIGHVLQAGHRTADLVVAQQAPPQESAPGLSEQRQQHLVSTSEMGKLVERAFAARLDRRFAYHAV